MNKNPKVAVIGIGRWGKNLVNTLVKLGYNVSHCFSNGGRENRDWLTKNHPNIKFADSYEEILNDWDIVAVFIATPIHTHYELAKQALEADKEVFLEKPGTDDVTTMQELVNLAKDKNLHLAVGYVFTHHPACRYLIEALKGEEIQSINFEWNKWGSFGEKIVDNLVVHELSILRVLGIEINGSTAITEVTAGISTGDIIHIQATSTQGFQISINVNRLSPTEKRKSVTVVTDKNVYVWLNNELRVAKRNSQDEPTVIAIDSDPALDLELINFMQAINGEAVIHTDGQFAVEILRIMKGL